MDIYDRDEEVNPFTNFALTAYDPINFNEDVKEEVWVKSMDEHISNP